ncbi:MAG: hypothetical protein RL733_68 [Actinomycetota bacterium]|jgi:hypothetical protein
MIRREFTIKWLQLVLGAVFIYSLLLVFKGSVAGSLFSWFGFGPNEAIETSEVQDYLLLPYMVLGAVMAGWVFLMILIVRGPLKDGSLWARKFLIQSLSLWFILDTSMSVVLGYPTHALFNVPFALALGIPLVLMKNEQT